jgi:YD repeat-containing protein
MAHGTSERTGGSKRPGTAIRPARRGRLASRVRAACVLLCVALLLQPSAMVIGRGASRPDAPAASRQRGLSLTVVTAHTLLKAAAGLAGGLRSLASALAPSLHTTGGFHTLAAGAASSSGSVVEPAASAVLLGPPTLSVVTTSDSQVSLSWTTVSGAVTYRVERTTNVLTPYSQVTETASTTYNDAGVSRGNTYLYRVRAVDGSSVQSPPSAVVMATAITFYEETLVAGSTTVKWQHVDDLRTAIRGVRRAAGLSDPSWQEAVTTGTPIHATQVQEMRDRLDEGLGALGLPVLAYYEPTLSTGANGTPIRKIHFDQLRERARSGSGVTGSGLTAYDFATARLDASNRTGEPGVDLVSRNFNWGLPLVSLPGRSGLDLGLSLSYNSLVWTRSGDYILFDGDWGTPAPGFRLGFPVVQGKFVDDQASKTAYMLVTTSGARVSLRQTATAGVYEAGDSSHLQLTENADGSLTVTTTGGTNMTYWIEGNAFKCTKVEDANGNYITASYDANGNLTTVTDTLGRALNFSYPDGYLKEITQTWHREVESGGTTQVVTETHNWARFTYADVAVRTSFPGLTVFGPANGQTFHALTEVQLSDNSAYTFGYTTWGQVNKIATFSPDGHTLNYVSLNLPADDSQSQSDCPRFTESHVWAAHWNNDADGVPATNGSEDAVTKYGDYNFAGGVGHADAPDGTRHQETYDTSGRKKGLTTEADEFSADDYQHPKKATAFEWHQDDDTLTYAQNPRVTRTDIYDYDTGGTQLNHRRTDVAYAAFGLVQDVIEYDSLAANEVRRTHTEYLPSSVNAGGAYLNKRIIGLPSEVDVYGVEAGQEALASKLTYDYDLTGEYMTDAGAVTQHDSLFGAGVTTRGNVCRVRRWDAQYPQDQSKSVFIETGYNTLGSAVFSRDALLHKTTVDYTDSFAGTDSDAVAGAKLAYPTKVTDPDTFSSTVEYNYDTGLQTKATDRKGAAVKSFFDSAGRRLKVRSEDNGAYMRWEYEASGLYAKQYTQVDTGYAETFVMSVTDGAGRVRGTLRELPNGTGGAYSAQRFEYDQVGQQVKIYNPTEVTVGTDISDISGWQPTGDDSTTNGGAGWTAFVTREYDWKGRLTREVSQDGAADRLVDYTGCGCAGGAVVTTKGELVPVPGTTNTARRVQKVYSDSLGREWKTEVYNWDGATVYSTATVKYDALDHVVRRRVYQGAAPGNTPDDEPTADSTDYQTAMAAYDGHGRLQSRHLPNQNAGAATTYVYNADDTVQSVTDARGVMTSFTYNARRLVTGISYDTQALAVVNGVRTAPTDKGGTTNVADTTAVGFTYDAAGNRLTMTDGSGSTTYHYDTMSRLTSEDRQFNGPLSATTFTLSYQYTLSGQVKSVTDVTSPSTPVGFSYDIDKTGQATAVESSNLGATGPLAHDMKYRASGALNAMSYGNGTGLSLSYNSRGLVTHYGVSGVTQDGQYGALAHGSDFDYYADGRVKYASDLFTDALSTKLHDRAYSYDHVGRLQEAYSGADANQLETGTASGVEGAFRQSYTYDAFGNTKGRTGRLWSADDNDTEPFAATGRNTAWEYDPDGRLVSRNETTQNGLTPYQPLRDSYDAAGRLVQTTQTTTNPSLIPNRPPVTTTPTKTEAYDGDGLISKQMGTGITGTTYYLRSTILGGRGVSEYDGTGARLVTHVSAGGASIADSWNNTGTPYVNWRHTNPVTGDELDTDSQGVVTSKATVDPTGTNLGDSDPADETTGGGDVGGMSQEQMNQRYAQLLPPSLGGDGPPVTVDGMEMSASAFYFLMSTGALKQCPNNDCGPQMVNGKLTPLTTDPKTGQLGYGQWVDGHDTDPSGNPGGSSTTTGPDGEDIIKINHNAVNGHWEYVDVSWSDDSIGLGPQNPVPQPHPTPTPLPTPTPRQKPNCFTIGMLLNLPEMKKILDSYWEMTEKSGGQEPDRKEYGGWMFYNPSTNVVTVVGPIEGDPRVYGQPATLGEKEISGFKETLKEYQAMGAIHIVDFHTHPGGTGPDGGDIFNINNPGKSPSAIGVIIQGPGKYAYYDSSGELKYYDDKIHSEEFDRCLPTKQ